MSSLRISFEFRTQDTNGALVVLEVLAPESGVVWSRPVPLGPPVEVQVAPGRYVVRTLLPSGELLSAQAGVEANQVRDVRLFSEREAPTPKLAWAYALKQVESVTSPSDDIRARSWSGQLPDWMQLWRISHRSEGPIWKRSRAPLRVSFPREDEGWDAPEVLAVIRIRMRGSSYWLQVGEVTAPRMIALPASAEVRVLILGAAGSETGDRLHVVVDGGDGTAEALLGYLKLGVLDRARSLTDVLVSQIKDGFFLGPAAPYRHVVLGYALLLCSRDLPGPWPLLSSTAARASWSDTDVIDGWFALRRGDLYHARQAFLRAAGTGPPAYTFGLRFLVDGLRMIEEATPDDDELMQARTIVSQYASIADWSSGTTNYLSDDLGQPLPRGARNAALLISPSTVEQRGLAGIGA